MLAGSIAPEKEKSKGSSSSSSHPPRADPGLVPNCPRAGDTDIPFPEVKPELPLRDLAEFAAERAVWND
eukprot:CAMPEP_0183447180 /NCGR_PEP_ID=MMETSP0370-20130417/101370_1 /TAXON_ID=268820 /ORGANISM="Peridinium aciculiferum, Strain PAER-2" /LENGTH=68 /DNA_ID=CAMNT_0025638013 /DNA_START=54 /DNA_END=257 /DNA_ORIENTATION=+